MMDSDDDNGYDYDDIYLHHTTRLHAAESSGKMDENAAEKYKPIMTDHQIHSVARDGAGL